MNYALDITSMFEDEVADTLNYIEFELGNKKTADSLENNINYVISSVADNPFLYPYYHNEKIAAKGYRFVTVSKYIIFYFVDEENKIIHIIRFIYGKHNIENMID